MDVCLYMRYSSDKQTEQSIEGQQRVCTEFCERNGYKVVAKYIDRATSAFTHIDKRVSFQKMIKDSEKHPWDAIVVYKLDRFARNRYDSATYKNKLKKAGVKVISATENISDNPEGVILESVLEGMAEFYSKELSQKITRGMNESAIKLQSLGGHVPLGYKIVNKKFEVDEAGAALVKEAFTRYANGETMADLINSFNDRGLKTSKGVDFNKNSFHSMLKNERYRGVYKYKDTRVEGGMPRIIDDETFERVQDRMQKNKKMPGRAKAEYPFILTGKLFCGHCNCHLIGDSGVSKHGITYRYYTCEGKKHRKGCKKKSIRKDTMEQIVFEEAMNMLTDENINLLAEMAVKAAAEENSQNTLIPQLEQQLKDIKSKIANLVKTFETGYISEAVVERIKALEEEQKSTELRLEDERLNDIAIDKYQVVYFLEKFAQGDIEDINFKRAMIDMLVHSVTVYDDPDGDKDTFKLVTAYNVMPSKTYSKAYSAKTLLSESMVYQKSIIRTPSEDWVYIRESKHRR